MRLLACLLGLIGTIGCAVDQHCADLSATERLAEPLWGGLPNEPLLALSRSELNSFVSLVDGSGRLLCSGTVVAPRFAVTARHCVEDQGVDGLTIRLGGIPESVLSITNIISHPDLDIALLELASDSRDLMADSIVANREPISQRDIGRFVELAGFGANQSLGLGARSFVVEQIISVDDAMVQVEGFGNSGGCIGDSGGPLLFRQRGRLVVGGVLNFGDASCKGRDAYVRLDVVSDWLIKYLVDAKAEPALPMGCDEIGSGRCFEQTAVFCTSGQMVSNDCDTSLVCGWSKADGGARCIDAAADACLGIPALGDCISGQVVTCRDGALTRRDCECGEACGRGPDGRARCLAPE